VHAKHPSRDNGRFFTPLFFSARIIAIALIERRISTEMSALHQESATSGKTDDRMLRRFSLPIFSARG
jgi:hypothetical protein